MDLQLGDIVWIRHEALLPNYLLGRQAIVSGLRKNGDVRVGVFLGHRPGTQMRFRILDVWKEEVELVT